MATKYSFSKLHTFIVGICVGITTILAIMVLTGNVPWLKAAGVGTGAPDVNARYLDGFTTQQGGTATANKIYVSNSNGWIPSGAIPDDDITSAKIVDGTIMNADVSASAAIAASKIADGSGSGLDADMVDGSHKTSFMGRVNCECKDATCSGNLCTATATCTSGKYIVAAGGAYHYSAYTCSGGAYSSSGTYGGTLTWLAGCMGQSSCSISDTSGDSNDVASLWIICCGY